MKLVLTALVLTLSACVQSQITVEPIALTANPSEELSKLEESQAKAKESHVHWMAPTWYQRSMESSAVAKRVLKEGGDVAVILDKVAIGKGQLNKAWEMNKVAGTLLTPMLNARLDAEKAGATANTSGYVAAEEQFMQVARSIEYNNIQYAENNRNQAEESWRSVELTAIKDKQLDYARKALANAEFYGASETIPTMYQLTKKKLATTTALIEKDRYNMAKITPAVKALNFQAGRMLVINKELIAMQASPEKWLLGLEGKLSNLEAITGTGDLRDKSFNEQMAHIAERGSVMVTTEKSMSAQLNNLQSSSKKVNSQMKSLKSEVEYDQLIAKIRASFGPGEAQIYKQGRNMVIRLKDFKFGYGKSVLLPEHDKVLNKLVMAISKFSAAEVLVEGHTDFTGSSDANMRLSSARAKTVKNFLTNKVSNPDLRISAVGRGANNPIASNGTKEGRATNRRIDIVVSPLTATAH